METNLDEAQQRKLAATLFNEVWRLLERTDRTADETTAMIHAAHASRFFWTAIGTPRNYSIGEWQIARVYSVLGRAEPAMYHAVLSAGWAAKPGVPEFYLAYAYEALARASALAGDRRNFEKFFALAREAGEKIEDEKDRATFELDLASLEVPQDVEE